MRFILTIFLSLYAILTFFWKFLPIIGGIIGYKLFAPPVWLGAAMAVVLGLIGCLAKNTISSLFYKPDTHGSARFASLADARKGRLLRRKGLILGRKHGRMLRYNGDGHLLTFAKPIVGPLALGFACHYGLGLFTAADEDKHAPH